MGQAFKCVGFIYCIYTYASFFGFVILKYRAADYKPGKAKSNPAEVRLAASTNFNPLNRQTVNYAYSYTSGDMLSGR